MTRQEYATTVKQEFARYGFTSCPLSNSMLSILWFDGVDTNGAYSIGCDMNAGFSFPESLDAWSAN